LYFFFSNPNNNTLAQRLVHLLPEREEFHIHNRAQDEIIKVEWRLTNEWVDNSDFKYRP
jgi:hypothetical protein